MVDFWFCCVCSFFFFVLSLLSFVYRSAGRLECAMIGIEIWFVIISWTPCLKISFFVVFFSAIPSFRVSFSLFVGWFVCLFCTDEVRSSFLFFSFFRVSVNCFAGFSLVASVVIFFASLFFRIFLSFFVGKRWSRGSRKKEIHTEAAPVLRESSISHRYGSRETQFHQRNTIPWYHFIRTKHLFRPEKKRTNLASFPDLSSLISKSFCFCFFFCAEKWKILGKY